MKHLIKKFSFIGIIEEISNHSWELPSSEEVKQAKIKYPVVWVRDLPPLKKDRDTHACIYDVENDKVEVCNKMFQWNIVVKEI